MRPTSIEPLESRRMLSAVYTGIEPRLVANVGPDADSFVNAGGTIYFGALDELWAIDPATSQKRLVRDILPGSTVGQIRSMTAVNERVFFVFDDGVNGGEIWTSDGTEAGTGMVLDINPGPAGSDPRYLTAIDGRLVFTVMLGPTGRNPWISDGTAAGTRMIAEVNPPATGKTPNDYFSLGGALYFFNNPSNGGELWRSDFTPQGTRQLLAVPKDGMDSYGGAHEPIVFGGRAFFRFHSYNWELWATDGTEAGTVKLRNVGGYTKLPRALPVDLGERLAFIGNDPVNGSEPWISDGTAEGTRILKDIVPGPADAVPGTMNGYPYFYQTAEVGGRMVFAVGSDYSQLWSTDGTPDGTVRIDPTLPTGPVVRFGTITRVGPRVVFSAETAMGITDGTPGGTVLLKRDGVTPNPFTTRRVAVGDELFFWSNNAVWKMGATDTLAPVVNAAAFDANGRLLLWEFSEDVSRSVAAEDFVIRNLSSGQTVPPAALEVTAVDAYGDRFRITFPGLPGGVLPDGNYRATLPAGSIHDHFANAMATGATHDFFVLGGDANRDRRVDSLDFARMAGNFNRPANFSGGDFDYSGVVGVSDFALLASRFNLTLPPADNATLPAARSVAPSGSRPGEAGRWAERIIDSISDGDDLIVHQTAK